MKKVSLVFLMVLCLMMISFLVKAEEQAIKEQQSYDYEFDYSDFAGLKTNGGPLIGMIHFNLGDLNGILEGDGFKPFDENMILFGGGGIAGDKNGPRIGGIGMSGQISTTGIDAKTATLMINYWGAIYEHGVFAHENTDISIGALVGGGSAELNIKHGLLEDFEDGVTNPRMTLYKKDFFLLQPKLNIHQKLSPFVGLDLDLGYLLTLDIGNTWKVNDQAVGGPLKNLAAPVVCLRISFGF